MVKQLRQMEGLSVIEAREVTGIFEVSLVMEGKR